MTELVEHLSSWTDSNRQRILSDSTLPLIDGREINMSGVVDDVWDDPPDQIRQSVESFLAHHFDDKDIAPRFVALSFLRALAVEVIDILDADGASYDDKTVKRAGYWEVLKDVVNLVDLENLSDPEIIKWEIVNACAVEDWDLASKLYTRLKDTASLSEQHFRALRGEFLFTAAEWEHTRAENRLARFLEWWYPTLEPTKLRALNKTLTASLPSEKQKVPSDDLLVRYRDAANDLMSAVELDSSLPLQIHLMLAESSRLVGDYLRAGHEYEHVLKQGIWTVWPGPLPGVRNSLYESAARSYRSAERPGDAMRLLKTCLEELPQSKGVWLQIAELQTQPPDADYRAAYESLRREVELNPDAAEDVRLSVALALGAVGAEGPELNKAVEQHLAKNPQEFELTKSLVQAHWPAFAELSVDAQTTWAQASRLLWVLKREEGLSGSDVLDQMALSGFGRVVECELRRCIFRPFQKLVKATPKLENLARAGLQRNETKPFCNFLIRNGKLTLGPMFHAIDDSMSRNTAGILKELSRFIQKEFRDLALKFGWLDWRRLNQLYSPTKHELGGNSRGDAEEMHSLCREFLSLLVGRSPASRTD